MANKTYSEKLVDPRWQKRRLEIFQRDSFTCQNCKDETATLNVHHRYYVGGRSVWNYPDVALVTLCNKCHEHERNISEAELGEWETALIVTEKSWEILDNIRCREQMDSARFLKWLESQYVKFLTEKGSK
jgi:hypothetical protein